MAIHPTALVAAGARLADGVAIGPFAVVEEGVEIGEGCEIRAHAVVKRHTRLGPGNLVHEHAVLGGEAQDVKFKGGPSGLEIGARNVIREGVTIHRASHAAGTTRVGSDCFLMAYAHVAHDCTLGDQVIVANNTALAGHVEIASQAFVSGGVMIHQFCRIGRLAMIGGNSTVRQDALPFVMTDGHPGRPYGLNVVGLRRAGLAAPDLRALREAHRLLLRAGLLQEAALERMTALAHPLVDELVAFVRGSKRGIARSVVADD